MGNTTSSKTINFISEIENIVVELLTKQSWLDMQKLENPEHCDKLIAITTDVLEKHLNSRQIKYLADRVKKGETKMKKLSWIPIHVLKELNKTKHYNCKEISKFYVKIGHIYTAIIKTINPQYVFNDKDNVKQKIPLLQYGSVPRDVEKKLEQFGFCQRRINALQYEINKDDTITINPSPCKLIQQKYRDQRGTCVTKYKTFAAEPGVPELLQLYKDVYSYEPKSRGGGRFNRVSEEGMKQYRLDLKHFYKTFTGKNLPDHIERFSQIKLKDYSCKYDQRIKCAPLKRERNIDPNKYQPVTLDTPRTQQPNIQPSYPTRVSFDVGLKSRPVAVESLPMRGGRKLDNRFLKVRHNAYTDKKTNNNFSKYANHLARMIEYAQKSHEDLLKILKEIFVEDGKSFKLHPQLNEDNLDKITKKTRETIVKLYIKCEEDFRKGLEIFDDIIQEKEMEKIDRQRTILKEELEDITNN